MRCKNATYVSDKSIQEMFIMSEVIENQTLAEKKDPIILQPILDETSDCSNWATWHIHASVLEQILGNRIRWRCWTGHVKTRGISTDGTAKWLDGTQGWLHVSNK